MSEDNNEAYLLTGSSMRELQGFMRNLWKTIDQRIANALTERTNPREKEVRVGTTVGYDPLAYDGAGEENSLYYPDSPANTFWVKLGKPEYTKEAGQQTLSVTPYDPPVYRLCHVPSGDYLEEGTDIWMTLIHGQYYMIPNGGAGADCGQGTLVSVQRNYDDQLEAEIYVTVAPCNDPGLLGQYITVIDHSECIFDHDEAALSGVWCWFVKGYTPLGCHWVAQDRCCVAEDYLDLS